MRKLLTGLTRGSTFLPLLALIFVAWIVLARMIPQNQIAIITNGVFISVWLGVMVAYGPVMLECLRASEVKKDQYLVTGILLIFSAIAGSRLWSMAIILAGKPDWMINAPIQSLCYLIAALSGFFFLKVPGTTKAGWRYTTMALITTTMFVTVWLAYVEGN